MEDRTDTNSPTNWPLFLLGTWTLISPRVLGFMGSRAAVSNNIVVGLAVMVVALMPTARSKVPALINAALGLWLIVSPFTLIFRDLAAFWNNIVLGALVVVSSFFALNTRRHA